jgi:argininosuccinate lyase
VTAEKKNAEKLWGGRFERKLFQADILGSQAYARALARVGILKADEAQTICDALARIPEEDAEGADDEDIHTFVIARLKELTGELADKIHTGRSRNEQVSLDTRLWVRNEIDRALKLLAGLLEALLESAEAHPNAVIPIRICAARNR